MCIRDRLSAIDGQLATTKTQSDEKITDLEGQVASLTTEVDDLTAARDALLEQKAGLEGDLAGLKESSATEISGLMSARDGIAGQLDELKLSSDGKVGELEGQVSSLTAEVEGLTAERDLLLERKATLESDLAGVKETSASEIAAVSYTHLTLPTIYSV